MSRQFHRVVQHARDQNPIVIELIGEEVARIPDQARLASPRPSAIAEVIGADLRPELRPVKTSDTRRIGKQVTQREGNEGFVSAAGLDAE